jgi:hypothetical protein
MRLPPGQSSEGPIQPVNASDAVSEGWVIWRLRPERAIEQKTHTDALSTLKNKFCSLGQSLSGLGR